MTAFHHLFLIAIIFAVMGWEAAVADDDVTVIPAPVTAQAPSQKTVAADGTPVIHKSLHKKKHHATETASTTPAAASAAVATGTNAPLPPAVTPASSTRSQASVVVGPATSNPLPSTTPSVTVGPSPTRTLPPPESASSIKIISISIPVPVAPAPAVHTAALVPTVETGLPVGRYTGMDGPIKGVSTYIPTTTPMPMPVKSVTGTTTHQPYYASILPSSVIPLTSATTGIYSTPSRTTSPPPDFVFANFSKKPKASYPWKMSIITTEFWIGEGGSSISPTDNIGSAWDENWRSHNRGNDNPDDRNGFASADHASTINPFYVALPFNDLAFPDKARDWVPRSWHRPNEDGKQVSACKDRWICIKNANGRSCYAQWEDVGPLRSDHAEYVFGEDRPDTYTRAGLDISPAVAQYLGIDGNRRAITSWKFVDDEDVPPGQWLKYDEQAVIFTAMHQLRNSSSTSDLPIQKATEPIDDENTESNKKRIDQSKG
jgi:hypothetical protein